MSGAPVQVRVGRVYEARRLGDGSRVLVDRLWPRGLTKPAADLDEWCKDVAPSTQLRRWYGHDPARFRDFTDRYRAELALPERAPVLSHLHDLSRSPGLILLTASRRPDISEATVLAELLREGVS